MDLIYIAADINSLCGGDLQPVWNLVGVVVKFLLLGIPVILVIMGLIDLGKAVMAGKDDEIKTAQKMLIKRIMYTIVAFLLVIIVGALLTMVDTSDSKSVAACLKTIFA